MPGTGGGLLLVGGVAGLAGAVAMDVPMNRQPEGWTPAFVAAATLRGGGLEAVSFRDASVIHHAAGACGGVLYGAIVAGLSAVARPGSAVGGLPLFSHLVGVVAVGTFVYAGFVYVVFPRASDVSRERTTAIRGQWLRSTAVYGLTLTVVAPALAVGL